MFVCCRRMPRLDSAAVCLAHQYQVLYISFLDAVQRNAMLPLEAIPWGYRNTSGNLSLYQSQELCNYREMISKILHN